ncbi:hypothetical protein [Acinetobacter thermotolerans]|nr:hypothetical protein GW12_27000 [Acinetobacter sp. HR7]
MDATVSHHDMDVMYGKQRAFAAFGPSKAGHCLNNSYLMNNGM